MTFEVNSDFGQLTGAESFYSKIYVGRKEAYGPKVHSELEINWACENFCNQKGLCVNITETEFVYVGGREVGAIVEIINYPRFPREKEEIRRLAFELAYLLKEKLGQLRVSVAFPDYTYMIGEK